MSCCHEDFALVSIYFSGKFCFLLAGDSLILAMILSMPSELYMSSIFSKISFSSSGSVPLVAFERLVTNGAPQAFASKRLQLVT